MFQKLIHDFKYFFERLFSKEGTPLLMLSIIAAVLAVIEMVLYIVFISNSVELSIPFLLFYTYALYFVNRLLIRTIQFILARTNVLKYRVDDFNYLESDFNAKIRKYNNAVYIKERDRFEATIVYIVTLIIFLFIILTFIATATTLVKIILILIIAVPFFIFLKEPYEIITIDVDEKDLQEMTRKDFFEDLLDKLFKEKQVTSIVELPGEDAPEPNINYTEEQNYAQEQNYQQQVYQEQQQAQYSNPVYQQQPVEQPQMPQPAPQQPMIEPPVKPLPGQYNPFNDVNKEIDPNTIPKQWWQQ